MMETNADCVNRCFGRRVVLEPGRHQPQAIDGALGVTLRTLRNRFRILGKNVSIEDELWIEAGSMADYRALSGFHYRGVRPGAVTSVVRMVRRGEGVVGRFLRARCGARPAEAGRAEMGSASDARVEVVGVLVRSLPHLSCRLRDVATGGRYQGLGKREQAVMLNREVRCISRVVIDPRWRGLGLAVKLVRWALQNPEAVSDPGANTAFPCAAQEAGPRRDALLGESATCATVGGAAANRTILYTEALAVMGRVSPFFERAGMVKFERPVRWRAEHARLIDAMERVGIEREMLWRPGEVMEHLGKHGRAEVLWFEGELRRWYGAAHRMRRAEVMEMGMDALLRAAGEEVMEGPVYYVFGHQAATVRR